MGEIIRAFIAVNLTGEIKEAVSRLIRESAGDLEGIRWVARENLHLTVKFLGGISHDAIGEVSRRLKGCLAEWRPFSISLAGLGAYPSTRRPRVLFVDMGEGRKEFSLLSGNVQREMEEAGYEPEKRESSPHLTVGRVKYLRDPDAIDRWFTRNRDFRAGSCSVDRLTLMKSVLHSQGAIYSILEEYAFGG